MSEESQITKMMVRSMITALKPKLRQRGQITLDICQLLHKLKEDNTFNLLTPDVNWETFLKLHKIPMGYAISNKAVNIYKQYKGKNYSEDSMVDILAEFGLSKTYELLRKFPTRVSIRALRKYDAENDPERGMQLHLEIQDASAKRCKKVMEKVGMEEDDRGRKVNASQAFEHMCANYAKLERFAKGKRGAPALSVVKKKAA